MIQYVKLIKQIGNIYNIFDYWGGRSMDPRVWEGRFGLEKENLRLTADGRLALTPHPFDDDPHISKDFCESQVEMITEVCDSTDGLYRAIRRLDRQVSDRIREDGEFLWNSSNPPEGAADGDVPVARFEGGDKVKEHYRRYLLEKYGAERMLLSGIHYNFSIGQGFIDLLGGNRDDIYLKLGAACLKYSWLIVYLTSASPRGDKSSVRCSSEGYWNDFVPTLDYTSVDSYVDSIEAYVNEGRLDSISELYLPVRLKPSGKNTTDNLRRGIDHIELRMIDINPLFPIGVSLEDLRFIHLFLIYMAVTEQENCTDRMQRTAVENMKRAAHLDDTGVWISQADGTVMPVREAALGQLALMEMFFEETGDPEVMKTLEYQKQKLLKYNGRYSEKISAMKRGKKKCANFMQSAPITA